MLKFTEAFDDLDKAIDLTHGKGKTASLAFVQRALLRKLDGDDENSLEDFKKAAALGNAFAKQQVKWLSVNGWDGRWHYLAPTEALSKLSLLLNLRPVLRAR